MLGRARIAQLEALVEDLKEVIREEDRRAREREAELVAEKHALEVKVAVLTERIDLMVNHFQAPPAGPLHVSEEVEDLDFAFRNGMLDRATYEKTLEAAGFDNTEIEFASADYPRLGS